MYISERDPATLLLLLLLLLAAVVDDDDDDEGGGVDQKRNKWRDGMCWRKNNH